MTSFTASLKESVQGLSDAASVADRDLHEVVHELSNSVGQITNGEMTVELRVLDEDLNKISYSVVVKYGDQGQVVKYGDQIWKDAGIAALSIPHSGYPIVAGEQLDNDEFREVARLQDKQALEEFFSEITKNRDSALVKQLAFYLRKAT